MKVCLFSMLWFCGVVSVLSDNVFISEVMPSNGKTLSDENGSYPDWLEISNSSESSVNLRGYGLSMDSSVPFRFKFPPFELKPKSKLIVFCSGDENKSYSSKAFNDLTFPSIQGERLHLDAGKEDTFVFHDNGSVQSWLDQSAMQNHASQPDPDKAPRFKIFYPNQIPTLKFDGENDFLRFGEIHGAHTIFMVCSEHPFASSSYRALLGHTSTMPMFRGPNKLLLHVVQASHFFPDGVHQNGNPIFGASTPAPVAPALLRFETSAKRRFNLVGANRLLDDQFWNGWFSEIIAYDRQLNAEEIELVEEYLLKRWGLPSQNIHVPFKIPNKRGLIYFTHVNGSRLDVFPVTETSRDISLVRRHSNDFVNFSEVATPLSEHDFEIFSGIVDSAKVDPPPGIYSGPLSVQIFHPSVGTEIRYSLDGNPPTISSPLYTGDLVLSESKVLKVRSFQRGKIPSKVQTFSYLLDYATTIPVISLSGSPDDWFSESEGIYMLGKNASSNLPYKGANFWREWEREVVVEWFSPQGECKLVQQAGAKIHGGWSRAGPQKSIALIARSRYGDSTFSGEFFKDREFDEYKQLLLRNAGNDWGKTMLRDPLAQSLMSHLDLDTQAYQPVNVFLNGEFMGLFNLRERVNEHFLSAHWGVSSDQIDIVNSVLESSSGDPLAAREFQNWLRNNSADNLDFELELGKRLDLNNFMDYLISEVYVGNTDWPVNNVKFGVPRIENGRFRWIPFDLDMGFNHSGNSSNLDPFKKLYQFRGLPTGAVFNKIISNNSLREKFAKKFLHYLDNHFLPERVILTIERLSEGIRREMSMQILRWGGQGVKNLFFPESIEQWNSNVTDLKKFAIERPAQLRKHLANKLDLNPPIPITIKLPVSEAGSMIVNGLSLMGNQSDEWTGHFFDEFESTIVAKPSSGWKFDEWAELKDPSAEITFQPSQIRSLTPVFSKVETVELDDVRGDIRISEIMYHPSTQRPNEEFIELVNVDDHPIELTGWVLDRGVRFKFPSYILQPGDYVVVSADPDAFALAYPDAPTPLGPWDGKLGNSGELIRLKDDQENVVDEVRFADEGEWSERVRGALINGFRGWTWSNAHDGGGHSLERILLDEWSGVGQNWSASESQAGTPGRPNSVLAEIVAPFISDVKHSPAVPKSTDIIRVTAKVDAIGDPQASVELHFRVDGASEFDVQPMQHTFEGIFEGHIPAMPDTTVVEFFVRAQNQSGLERYWPRPTPEGQTANALYQVDDQVQVTDQPVARVITTEAERVELEAIGKLPWNASSDAQMNATFIIEENGEFEVHYLTGFRLRGTTSRILNPKNRRVNFASDNTWRDRASIIFNAVNVPSQVLGSALFRLGGVPTPACRPVVFLENNRNHARAGFPQFGSYAQLEVLDDQYTKKQFDGDGEGNLYRAFGFGSLDYLGPDPLEYQKFGFYTKSTNMEEDDWSDLINMTKRLNESSDADYEKVAESLIHVESWLRFFAIDSLIANMETSLANGGVGDYAFYIGEKDDRTTLLPYDLDSILGMAVSGLNASIHRAIANPVPSRFLKSHGFARRYYAVLDELASTLFAAEDIESIIGNILHGWTTPEFVDRIQQFANQRRAAVLSQIPRSLTVHIDLPLADPDYLRYYQSNTDSIALWGRADVLHADKILVQGQEANWSTWNGHWSIENVALHAGVNEIFIQVLNEQGEEIDSFSFRVFREGEPDVLYSGTLTEDTTWSPEMSPVRIESDLIIPVGVTLTILPGTSVEFMQGAGMTVRGQIKALGTEDQRIYFASQRFTAQRWGGLSLKIRWSITN